MGGGTEGGIYVQGIMSRLTVLNTPKIPVVKWLEKKSAKCIYHLPNRVCKFMILLCVFFSPLKAFLNMLKWCPRLLSQYVCGGRGVGLMMEHWLYEGLSYPSFYLCVFFIIKDKEALKNTPAIKLAGVNIHLYLKLFTNGNCLEVQNMIHTTWLWDLKALRFKQIISDGKFYRCT